MKQFPVITILVFFTFLIGCSDKIEDSNLEFDEKSDNTSECPNWVDGEQYYTDDIVEYEGSNYIAVHDNPGYEPTISTWFWDSTSQSCNEWREANLTHYTSYPDPGSDECIYYNGCEWAGYFAFVEGQMTVDWVASHNIIAIHSKDSEKYALKTFRLRQGDLEIDAVVYDMCADSDCEGCCTENANANGIGFLIDIESYTMQRFGSGDGIVEWKCLDCD